VLLVDGMNVRPGRHDARPLMMNLVQTSPPAGTCRTQLVVLPGGERTWTVVDRDHSVVVPAEEFLEFMRATGRSPNTVKSYARALALWWEFLGAYGLAWDQVRVEDVGAFLTWLRSGDTPAVASIAPRQARFSEETIAVRLQAVMSLYRHHHLNGVETASRLYERLLRPGGAYKPFLEHIARKRPSARQVVKVKRARPSIPPTLTPAQIEAICDACARWDRQRREWVGTLRDRLLWALLAETGLRLGEALGLQHRDWHTGRGDTPFIEVRPREHAHGVRVKGGAYRKLYVSDELDRLYGEYLFWLCDAGVDTAFADFDGACVFVNLVREPLYAPMRPETVYWLVRRLRRELAGRVPERFTPHWFRHTHATALLLSGVPAHVVARRLGHTDVQTTLNIYAWVSDDAELRAVADWRAFTAHWRPTVED
jgi:integrase